MSIVEQIKPLIQLSRLIHELNEDNSTLHKKKVLADYPECKDLLKWVYNSFVKFHVTSKTINQFTDYQTDGVECRYGTIFELMRALSDRDVTGHEALIQVNRFMRGMNEELKNLVLMIIDRNLEVRVGAELINSVYPNLIPVFKIAKAKDYNDYKHRVDFKRDEWFASRKMDGLRLPIQINSPTDFKFWTSKGHEYFTFERIAEYLTEFMARDNYARTILPGHVQDGEGCIIDENGEEDFYRIVGEAKRHNHAIENPMHNVFDLIPIEDFEARQGDSLLIYRQGVLNRVFRYEFNDLGASKGRVDIIQQIRVMDEAHLLRLSEMAVRRGWEGLIIRKNAPYVGKRGPDLLKVKEHHDMEFVVIDVEMGPIRKIEKGREVKKIMLSAAKVRFKGNVVSVGSGFKIWQREHFHEHPEELLGKTITVRYTMESQDDKGNPSLRFPRFRVLHGEKRET